MAKREPNEKDISELDFANKFFNMQCGQLHLGWHLDAYWALVTKEIILPGALAIHQALVEKNYTEANKFRFNDADDTIFFIPKQDGKDEIDGKMSKKVFVHTTQSRDFLYVISDTNYSSRMHIRRIWRTWNEERAFYKEKTVLKDISTAIRYSEWLSEYNDDHYTYPRRPSLQFYRDINFSIPTNKDIRVNESLRRAYGDFRDPGCILSYELHKDEYHNDNGRLEGSRIAMCDLEMVSTHYIPCIAIELGLDVKGLNGYP